MKRTKTLVRKQPNTCQLRVVIFHTTSNRMMDMHLSTDDQIQQMFASYVNNQKHEQ